MRNYPGESSTSSWRANFATDKKASRINMLRTRGKRVVAEVTIPDAPCVDDAHHSAPTAVPGAACVSHLGGFLSGVNNNGAHSANGITALFIATGQDAANVAESSAALGLLRAAPERRLLLLDHPARR